MILELKLGEMLLNDRLPSSGLLSLKVPDFIFGSVPFNDNSVGYEINVQEQKGQIFLNLIPEKGENPLKGKLSLGFRQSPTIVINIDFQAEYGGDR